MNRRVRTYFILAGTAIIIAGASFGARWDNRSTTKPPERQTDTDTQKTGETIMLTATKTQGTVHHATESDFEQLVLNADVPVLVDFYADWCGPCRMVAPVLDELATETSEARIVKVNVDHSPQLAARYGISSIPSLKVFKDAEVVDEHLGVASKRQMRKMLGL
jgi:thioredoxin 1